MESLVAFVGADYVLFAADTSNAHSIVMMKTDDDKISALDPYKLMAANGDTGDRHQFCEYIKRNVALYGFRQNIPFSVHAAAHFARAELSEALRKNPYQVNLLIGGVDKDEGPSLYFLDYLGALNKQDFACQGYAGYFLLSLLDKHYRKGMNFEDGLDLVHKCINQMKTRFVLNVNNWVVKVVDQNGSRIVETIGGAKQLQPDNSMVL